jgi:hypothetical protein
VSYDQLAMSVKRPPLDVCRIRPDRLRALSTSRLRRVAENIISRATFGRRRQPHAGLLFGYVNALLWTRLPPNQGSPRLRQKHARKAVRLERKILEIQQREGCRAR